MSKCVKCVCNIWTSSFSFPVPSGVQLGDGQLQAALRGPPVSRQLRQLLDQLCGAQTAGTHPARPPLSLERCWRCWVGEGWGSGRGPWRAEWRTLTLYKRCWKSLGRPFLYLLFSVLHSDHVLANQAATVRELLWSRTSRAVIDALRRFCIVNAKKKKCVKVRRLFSLFMILNLPSKSDFWNMLCM